MQAMMNLTLLPYTGVGGGGGGAVVQFVKNQNKLISMCMNTLKNSFKVVLVIMLIRFDR
jgi:hypothetical protein